MKFAHDCDDAGARNRRSKHDVGDLLLREVAQRLCTGVRRGDTVARLGGDEFVLVVIDIGRDRAEAAAALESIAQQILALLNTSFHFGNITHVTSGSIGLTLFQDDSASAEDVLKHADLAMYKAKETGRNACRFFDPAMEAVVRQRAALEVDLLRALVDNQFELHYQAQVRSDGRLNGAEALIRWQHPQRGLMYPDDLIPFAEETGLILRLNALLRSPSVTTFASCPVRAADG